MVIDPTDPRFADAGLHIVVGGARATLHDLDEEGRPNPVWHTQVAVQDGKLSFWPMRSCGQRKALARIGLPQSEPTFP